MLFNRKKKKTTGGIGARIADLFRKDGTREVFFEDLEDLLIEADLGGTVTAEVVEQIRDVVKEKKLKTEEDILSEFRNILGEFLLPTPLTVVEDKLNLFMILGVNGVGKTTTIAKLAWYFQQQGVKGIVMSAGDTFRAAAIDQLKIQGERTQCRVVSQDHGADPGAVIYDTIVSAQSKGDALILADTAGRMHTKKHLVKELEKVNKVITGKLTDGIYKKILVIDATTGQNGLHQAEVFHEAVGIDGVILTKFDSTARGGLLIAISRKLKLPVFFLGKGEGLADLEAFDAQSYLDELLRKE